MERLREAAGSLGGCSGLYGRLPVTVAMLLCACAVPGQPNGEAPAVGDPVPAVALSGDRPALVWVFDARECLGCNLGDPARTVRALQRSLGDRVEFLVVAVGERGDQDRDLVVGFLASQRISARVVVLSRADYALAFGRARLAVFYVTNRNSVIVAKVDSDVADAWRSPSDSLDLATYLQALVERGASAGQGMRERSVLQQQFNEGVRNNAGTE